MKKILTLYSLSLFFCLPSCTLPDDASNNLLIENIRIISMTSGEIVDNHNILIKDNLIVQVDSSHRIKTLKKTKSIDGQGMYVIPGLADMHMHIDHPDVLGVFLAHGVTSVMNYRGLPEHLELREQSESNEIFSPIIYTTGDYMEGYPATFHGFLSFDDTEDVRKSVREQKEKGYDFIKVYRNVDTTLHQAICEEAALQDMTVVGHLSPDISLEQSLKAGQKIVSHVEEVMYFFDNENDTTRIDDLVKLFKDYDVTFTPNLCIFRSIPQQVEKIDSLNQEEYLKYLQPALRQSWRKEFNYNHPRGQDFAQFMKDRFVFLQKVTRKLHQAGVPILASSDAPTAGAFPGISVYQELKELQTIGLSPLEALRTATYEPGKFIANYLTQTTPFGLIEKGYRADLLFLPENPIEDTDHIRDIHTIIKNGTVYSKDSINQHLQALATNYAEIGIEVKEIERLLSQDSVSAAMTYHSAVKNESPDQLFLGYYTMGYYGYRYIYENRSMTNDPQRAAKAIDFYSMYLSDYPHMHGSYYLKGLAHEANKDTISAVQAFRRSMELHPYNPYARRKLTTLDANR